VHHLFDAIARQTLWGLCLQEDWQHGF